MKIIGIYPKGICNIVVQSGWRRDLKVERQLCYGDGFSRHNIDGRFYWYYDEEQVYHIEDSKTGKIVYIAIARNPQEVIDEFLKIKEELEKQFKENYMSKELEAIEEIKNHKIKLDVDIKYDNGNETQHRFETIKDMFPKQFAIIETALKRISELERENFELSEQVGMYATYKCEDEKKLKAFEIIKDKEVNILWSYCSFELNCSSEEQCENYNRQWKYLPCKEEHYLTKVEFDLLKEVLL